MARLPHGLVRGDGFFSCGSAAEERGGVVNRCRVRGKGFVYYIQYSGAECVMCHDVVPGGNGVGEH